MRQFDFMLLLNVARSPQYLLAAAVTVVKLFTHWHTTDIKSSVNYLCLSCLSAVVSFCDVSNRTGS